MSQISQPVRIILIGAVVFLAAWFTLLRPKGEAVPSPTATTTTTTPPVSTPQTGLGRAVEAAKKAAGQSTAAATATPATGTGSATTSAPDVKAEKAPIAAVPAAVLAKLPKDVAGALSARKVLVLGVLSADAKPWRPLADDDRYVRNALEGVNTYKGGVVVKPVALEKLSTYGSLVNDLGVTQSPSIVVIDRDLKGTVLEGYVDRVAINQVIADARRVSITPNLSDAYLRKVNSLCGHAQTRLDRWSRPTVRGRKARLASYKRLQAVVHAYGRQATRLRAPARWQGLKAKWLKVLKGDRASIDAKVKSVGSGRSVEPTTVTRAEDIAALTTAFNAAGVTDCSLDRAS